MKNSKPAKILIIDDEQLICDGCRLVLCEEGHSVEFRTNGRTGLEAIREGDYDVLLLDMKLPDIDGIEILRTVRNQKPGMYVIVMTGYSSVRDAVDAMQLGAMDYLPKPFSDEELVRAVQGIIEKKRLVIVGEDPKILKALDQVRKIARAGSLALIFGESGTGRELFARAIHAHSLRVTEKFVALDCSSLSPRLLESRLFGHLKDGCNGVTQDKAGIFEVVKDGTLFLDDVADLTMKTQEKLLRVLEASEYKPVGGVHFKRTNVRVIAGSKNDLQAMVDEGSFNKGLFQRFNVFPIFLPPLRRRKGDIPKLANHFLRHFCSKTEKRIDGFSDDAMDMLTNHEWPGNVRQLKNVIERLVITADLDILEGTDLLELAQMER
jgi:DNA-binding NtrC family response regulator